MNRRLKEYLNFESLKRFLKDNQLKNSGIKSELLDRINDSLENGSLDRDDWESYISNELKYGHNRAIYFSKLNSASLHKVRNRVRLIEALSSAELSFNNFSDYINAFPESEEPELAHLHIYHDDDMVNKVEMCFVNMVMVNKAADEGEFIQVDETDYIWVEIDLTKEVICISLRPRSNTNETSGRTLQLFDKITSLMTDIFSLRYLSNDHMKTTLYTIFRELTSKAEHPYVEKVKLLASEIEEICQKYAADLELPSEKDPVNLPFRFRRLLERALIQNDFYHFKAYSSGKLGTVEKFFYADDTGARVNAAANEGDGIELSDIYFDTRETIDDQRKFNKLWVTWFMPKDFPVRDCNVRLEVTSKYFVLHFYSYLQGAEKNHVLSTIDTFRELQY
ncbi:hypothetical protein [Paenibacillus lutrae]|uniref:SAP domain-containing protein n=1 Tax=Paenibacillus lutrae TaxID=2078573 RepID=A0A7X3JZU2_9BACL|nr:hypothetical protein [Paenibacillus lutrae]MVP00397.1 hypothetical protein [Paenibacillus lutrae]